MARLDYAGVEVDRCTQCHGIFFDQTERERLLNMKAADELDIGDPRTGIEFNKVDRIQCPRCNSPMIRMVDLNQPHIRFEHCTVCSGAFFDAGEFADLQHYNLIDVFRDLALKKRTLPSRSSQK